MKKKKPKITHTLMKPGKLFALAAVLYVKLYNRTNKLTSITPIVDKAADPDQSSFFASELAKDRPSGLMADLRVH